MSKATYLAGRLEQYASGTLFSTRNDDDLLDAANELRRLYAFNESLIKQRDAHWINKDMLGNLQKLLTNENMQAEFELQYAKEWKKVSTREAGTPIEDLQQRVMDLREGNGYGSVYKYLNYKWVGWQACVHFIQGKENQDDIATTTD